MSTKRQQIAAAVLQVIQKNAPCQFVYEDGRVCGAVDYKLVLREQHGVDLQCRSCGRYVEGKAYRCDRPLPDGDENAGPRRRQIPGGSHAAWERQQIQGHRVDLHVAEYDDRGTVLIRCVRSEDQPADLRSERVVMSGERAGHRLADLHIGALAPEVFPVIGHGRLPRRVLGWLRHATVGAAAGP